MLLNMMWTKARTPMTRNDTQVVYVHRVPLTCRLLRILLNMSSLVTNEQLTQSTMSIDAINTAPRELNSCPSA